MIFRLVQLLMWLLKSLWDALLLWKVAGFHEQRTAWISFRILCNALMSLWIWTISSLPLWLAWLLQTFSNVIMVIDLRRQTNPVSCWPKHLACCAALQSGWVLGVCVFWPWCRELLSQDGSIQYLILGTIASLLFSGLLFLAVAIRRPLDLDRKVRLILFGVSAVNVLTANQFMITGGHLGAGFCLVAGCYSALISVALQYWIQRNDLQKKEEQLRIADEDLKTARKKVEQGTEQLHELKHSLKDHLMIVRILMQDGQLEKAEEYLAKLTGAYTLDLVTFYCQDPMMNALLNQIVLTHPAIHFDLQVDPQLIDPPEELIEILFLAADNACEELMRNPQLAQTARIQVLRRSGEICCRIENPLSGTKDLKSEKSEDGHGIGLRRIHKLAAAMDGTVTIEQDRIFRVTVIAVHSDKPESSAHGFSV